MTMTIKINYNNAAMYLKRLARRRKSVILLKFRGGEEEGILDPWALSSCLIGIQLVSQNVSHTSTIYIYINEKKKFTSPPLDARARIICASVFIPSLLLITTAPHIRPYHNWEERVPTRIVHVFIYGRHTHTHIKLWGYYEKYEWHFRCSQLKMDLWWTGRRRRYRRGKSRVCFVW